MATPMRSPSFDGTTAASTETHKELGILAGGTPVYVVALYDYKAEDGRQLDLKKNQWLLLLDGSKLWWKVRDADGNSGFVPSNYVALRRSSLVDGLKSAVTGLSLLLRGKAAKKNGDKTKGNRNTWAAPVGSIDKKVTCTSASRPPPFLKASRQIQEEEMQSPTYLELMENSVYQAEPSSSSVSKQPETVTVPVDTQTSGESTLDTMVALFSYSSLRKEELSFEHNERLDVLIDNSSPWWMASNERGDVGLVPSNYLGSLPGESSLETLSPLDEVLAARDSNHQRCSLTLHNVAVDQCITSAGSHIPSLAGNERQTSCSVGMPFFHSGINRKNCESLLKLTGDFLLRESSKAGDFTVSVKGITKIHHFLVERTAGVSVSIGDHEFSSMDDLIAHYRKHPIFRNDSEKLVLCKAVSR